MAVHGYGGKKNKFWSFGIPLSSIHAFTLFFFPPFSLLFHPRFWLFLDGIIIMLSMFCYVGRCVCLDGPKFYFGWEI